MELYELQTFKFNSFQGTNTFFNKTRSFEDINFDTHFIILCVR